MLLRLFRHPIEIAGIGLMPLSGEPAVFERTFEGESQQRLADTRDDAKLLRERVLDLVELLLRLL